MIALFLRPLIFNIMNIPPLTTITYNNGNLNQPLKNPIDFKRFLKVLKYSFTSYFACPNTLINCFFGFWLMSKNKNCFHFGLSNIRGLINQVEV
jgi:hypothetical protein